MVYTVWFPIPYLDLPLHLFAMFKTGVEHSIPPLVYYYKFVERFGHVFINSGWAGLHASTVWKKKKVMRLVHS